MALVKNQAYFDINGNLLPYSLQKMSDTQAKNILIDSFNPSDRRRELWEKFNRYRCEMVSLLKYSAEQWIDGSYVTTKESPGDIDVVTYIDIKDCILYQNELKQFQTRYGSKVRYGIDGYIVPVFSTHDPYYVTITKDRIDYWTKWFGTNRDNKPKGIVVLELSCS